MLSTESVSKGCFAFKPNGGTSRKSKTKLHDPLDDVTSEVWYKSYTDVWSEIEKKLEGLEDGVSEKLLSDLVQFISESSTGQETIPTATLLTGVNLPDHDSLFGRLSIKLRSEVTKHIALLRATDCPTLKHTIERMTGQLIANLTTQNESILEDSDEEEDGENNKYSEMKRAECTMPRLLEWYQSAECPSPVKKAKPASRPKLVVIIPEFEAFPSKLLHQFILILSGYVHKLPIVLVLGVATTVSALNNALPHKVTSRLNIKLFQSQPSIYFLNNTLDKVFLTSDCPFQLGPKVFKFLTDVFLFYDFSVNGFTQGIKYCVMHHFYERPASMICCKEKKLEKKVEALNKDQLESIRRLISFRKYVESQTPVEQISLLTDDKFLKKAVLKLMKELKKHIFKFHVSLKLLQILVSQLPQAPLGKQLRELYCISISDSVTDTAEYKQCVQFLGFQAKDELLSKLNQMESYLNGLDTKSSWISNLKEKLLDVKIELNNAGVNKLTLSPTKSPRKLDLNVKNRAQLKQKLAEMGKSEETGYEKTRKSVLDYFTKELFVECLKPISRRYLHELVLCDNANSIKRRVVGTPRAALHTALNNPQHYLQCDCCGVDHASEIRQNMPDICIVYKLHLESGALINMYDWLLAFRTVIDPESSAVEENKQVDPEIQARFTQAVAELEFLGFIKSSKRKMDHVARLTWGGTL